VTTTRQKVLAHLRKARMASAREIGRALNLSAPAVRHHLSVLASDGRIVQLKEARKEGRGRPVKVFGLSPVLQGNNLALLSDLLLEYFLDYVPPAERQGVLNDLARAMSRSRRGVQGDSESPEFSLPKRLASTIEILNELNYQARWEAGPEGPRIIPGYCPYGEIIGKHPELCSMDSALLEIHLGRGVIRTQRVEPAVPKMCPFAFLIR
jgi:predicted ArsR family transcriptional regulator